MTLSIVRLRESHTLVGLYSASSQEHLASLVSEHCAPIDCEFASIPDAGVFACKPLSVALDENYGSDMRTPDPEVSSISFEVFSPTAGLEDALLSPTTSWSPLDPDGKHPSSELDNLLASTQGRAAIARATASFKNISLA
jgi:hypothetical protein